MKTYEKLRDQVLERDVREVLANDRRLAHLQLAVQVDGGVLHLQGEVGSVEEARRLRRALARVTGILAVWDLVRLPGQEDLRVIDIGCGATKQKTYAFGIDRVPTGAVDVVTDLEQAVPLATASVDHVFAVHVLEHVLDVFCLLEEIHRVLKPTGVLHVMVPEWRHPNAVADPTHLRFFGPETFRHFCEPRNGSRPFEPVALNATVDTVFADLEPVHDQHSVPYDEVVARFFA